MRAGPLLDHLIRPPQQRRRNRKADRLGRLEVDASSGPVVGATQWHGAAIRPDFRGRDGGSAITPRNTSLLSRPALRTIRRSLADLLSCRRTERRAAPMAHLRGV